MRTRPAVICTFAPMLWCTRSPMRANINDVNSRRGDAEDGAVNRNELRVSDLPSGTVTLLLADVEGSTRLWQTQPEEMTAAGISIQAGVEETRRVIE